jgi:hypothetical protein
MLARGRYAMLDDNNIGFSWVPWKPVIEQRLGQQIAATVEGVASSGKLAVSEERELVKHFAALWLNPYMDRYHMH